MNKYFQIMKTEIGNLTLIENHLNTITGVYLNNFSIKGLINAETPLLKQLKEQLRQYFQGERKKFDIPTSQPLTPFQAEVYDLLKEVDYGYTLTYGDVAFLLRNEKAARAVGNALGKNNLLILVPCHRVVGKDSLGGFTGGLGAKEKLLKLEGRFSNE